jgi:translation initiation factor eIF-2B subunit delta
MLNWLYLFFSLGTVGNIHPAIIKLGVQYAKGVICGSNARCVALLMALKKVFHQFDSMYPIQSHL